MPKKRSAISISTEGIVVIDPGTSQPQSDFCREGGFCITKDLKRATSWAKGKFKKQPAVVIFNNDFEEDQYFKHSNYIFNMNDNGDT